MHRKPVTACVALLALLSASIIQAACLAPSWDVTTAYSRGDEVSHDHHGWRAKRNTMGVEPGTHRPTWADLGACEDGGEPPPPPPPAEGPMEIFGLWHAGNHYADWALTRDPVEFDVANHWIIDRGDGSGLPSVNLVVLSFLHPMEVLTMDPSDPSTGVPVGMNQWVVDYFKSAGIRVMMSIGGITYVDAWNQALATNATLLGQNAAAIAAEFGVGIEIDYEENTDPDLAGLQAFIDAYRGEHPYDPGGSNPAARLTIDVAAGGRWLIALNRHATTYWLDNGSPVLDYANAMVARSSGTPSDWQEHIDGKPNYDPVVPPKAPNRFTGSLYLKGNLANCTNFDASEQAAYADYVTTVAPASPEIGLTAGMLGYMFWAAEYPSARKNYVGTVPPNSCEGGMGVAATVFDIALPMPPLRQN